MGKKRVERGRRRRSRSVPEECRRRSKQGRNAGRFVVFFSSDQAHNTYPSITPSSDSTEGRQASFHCRFFLLPHEFSAPPLCHRRHHRRTSRPSMCTAFAANKPLYFFSLDVSSIFGSLFLALSAVLVFLPRGGIRQELRRERAEMLRLGQEYSTLAVVRHPFYTQRDTGLSLSS